MKRKISSILFALLFLTGLGILLYPTVSDMWNAYRQNKLITGYEEAVAELDPETYEEVWEAARVYNRGLWTKGNRYLFSQEDREEYEGLLNISGGGVMAYVEIPSISCSLPIYHGTNEEVLQTAVGHLEGSSLPVGGNGTHCVLSGHRGLPSAKLFTNLDQVQEGDIFKLRVLNEILTYQVDQIRTVLPQEMEELELTAGKDYCTLVTCTPYGVNSHRLLVRGIRIENIEEEQPEEVQQPEPEEAGTWKPDWLLIPAVGIPLLFIVLLILLVKFKRKR